MKPPDFRGFSEKRVLIYWYSLRLIGNANDGNTNDEENIMKHKNVKWLVVSLLALLPAACGNDESAAKAPPQQESVQETSFDPCALLTSEEIEAALGWKVATAVAQSYGATGTCTYASATPYSAQGMQQLAVVIGFGAPVLSSAKDMAEWRLEQYSGDAYKDMGPLVLPVEGLGVPAIQNGMEGMFGIELLVGDKLLTLSLFETLEPARALAAKALARME